MDEIEIWDIETKIKLSKDVILYYCLEFERNLHKKKKIKRRNKITNLLINLYIPFGKQQWGSDWPIWFFIGKKTRNLFGPKVRVYGFHFIHLYLPFCQNSLMTQRMFCCLHNTVEKRREFENPNLYGVYVWHDKE